MTMGHSWHVSRDAGGGAVITASHNPAIWNGYKYKPDYGGSASPEIVEELERRIAYAEDSGNVPRMSLSEAQSKGLLEFIDPEPGYLNHVAGCPSVTDSDVNKYDGESTKVKLNLASYFNRLTNV